MKERTIYYIFLIFSAGITLSSCVKKPKYSSIPEIEYRDFIRYGNNPMNPDSFEVVIAFKDNEGDIGIAEEDMVGEFKEGNLWMTYFYDSLGAWAALDTSNSPTSPFDTLRLTYPVPVVLPEGDDEEPMKGLIYVKKKPFFAVHERIKFSIYMKDMARNKSNVVETPPLVFEP